MKKKLLIVVKTYPTRSKKYEELVCTAGIDDEGKWYRIYPIPSKSLKEYEGLKKYTWIEAEINKDTRDPRPESYKINTSSVKLLKWIDSKKSWSYRKDIVLKASVYKDIKEIIKLANKENSLSIALFKPKRFLNVYFEKKDIEEIDKKKFINANLDLFEHESCAVEFGMMPPLSHSIKIQFEDEKGEVRKLSVLDWEIGQLFLKYTDKKEAKQKVKEKMLELFEKDLYLILGTMRTMHGWTSNPFTIIGLFYPPKDTSYTRSLF